MWAAIDRHIFCGNFEVKKERFAMTCEFKCLFGLSESIPGLTPGTTDETFARGVASVVATGKGGKVFWYLFGRMDRVYKSHEIPRFDDRDAAAFVQQHFKLPIRPRGSITIGDLWERRLLATLTPLEEADFACWTAGRIVCVGDSAHKMTPHTAAAGMLAIEHASALSNVLSKLAGNITSSPPTTSQIETALQEYDTDRLHTRTSEKIKAAAFLARLQTMSSFTHRMIVRFLLPHAGDLRADQFCDDSVGSERIDFLPLPSRSLKGTMPFNPGHGIGRHEKWWRRAIVALPLPVMAIMAFAIMYSIVPLEGLQRVLTEGVYQWDEDGRHRAVGIQEQFYYIRQMDRFSRPGVVRFVVSQVHFFHQPFSFFFDYGVWYAIMLIESARRAHHFTVLRFATLWGILNMYGIAITTPMYYFAYYILTPIAVFDASDMRLTDLAYTRTTLPVVLGTHYATFLGAYLFPTTSQRQAAGYLWELFPLWLFLAQKGLVKLAISPSTVQQDRLKNTTRDLPAIRTTILILCLLSTIVWHYTIWCSEQSMVGAFLPMPGKTPVLGFEELFAEFLKWDQVFFAIPNIFWIGLLYRDLKVAGLLCVSWLNVFLCAIGLWTVAGNGTMLGLMWLYREETLATRRHKDAVTAEVQKANI